MTVDLVLDALSNAITIQQPDEGLIFHTDLGSQYTSDAFEEAMTDAKMSIHLVAKAAHMITPALSLFMQH